MAGKPHPVDYSFGPGKSPTMGAVNAAGFAANATGVGYLAGATPWLGVGLGAVFAAASVVVLVADDHVRHTQGRAVAYRMACWLGAGIWATIQLRVRPWSWSNVVALFILAAIAAGVGELLRSGEGKREAAAVEKKRVADEMFAAAQAAATAATMTEEERIAAYWLPRFRRICRCPGLVIEGVQVWPTGDGYTLGLLLPDDGTTFDKLKPHEQALATSADLGPGCNVELLGHITGQSRRVVHARINTVNALADPQPYPDDYSDRTILDPIPVGLASDRSIATIHLADDGAAIVGQKGSGKSTHLNVLTAGVARCTDALLFGIDTKGNGEWVRRWLRAWYEGRAERPAFHLVAVTDLQALMLTHGLINIAEGRPAAYADLMTAQNSMKFLPSPATPQIILLVDELKSLPDAVKANIETLNDKGRSAGIEVAVCALEATSGALPGGILAQMRERVGLRFNDEAHLQYLFDRTWRSGRFDPSTMTHPGMMMVSTGAQPPQQVKGYDLDPKRIDEIAIAVGEQRPALDQASIDMFDTITVRVRNSKGDWVYETATGVYATWWDVTLPLMFQGAKPKPAPAGPAQTRSTAAAGAPQPGSVDVFDMLAGSSARLKEALDAARTEAAAADAEHARQVADPDTAPATRRDPVFDALIEQAQITARERYRQIIVDHGPVGGTGISSRLRLEGYDTTRQTVQGWLKDDETAGRVVREKDGWRWVG